jgi:glycosyltransferase involved in cell wall biosynthesis
MADFALSFVIPLFNSATTIGALVHDIEALEVAGGHEIVLVNDGSTDSTASVCSELVRAARVPMIYVEHARNFGEHNAVLTGWRHARGRHLVNLDDDGQNPPAEALRLWKHARDVGLDVVFGHYDVKRHATWRNAGSFLTGKVTDWALDKPKGLYLSSFRCVTSFVAGEAIRYAGPYPYIDGLLLQVTQRVGSIDVRHLPRQGGRSSYTLRRLMRLWLSAWINSSVLPLRVATMLGLAVATVGLMGLAWVFALWLTDRGPPQGWGWLMSGMLVFSGVQLVMLGLIGEYLGRMFLAVNQKPQSVVRRVERSPHS